MNSSYGQYLSFIENTYLPELEMSKKDLRPSVDLTYSLSESDNYSAAIDHRRSSSLSLSLAFLFMTVIKMKIILILRNIIIKKIIRA